MMKVATFALLLFVVETSEGQRRSLPSRLRPPPKHSSFVSGRERPSPLPPVISHLTLHPQPGPGNKVLAQIHTGGLPAGNIRAGSFYVSDVQTHGPVLSHQLLQHDSLTNSVHKKRSPETVRSLSGGLSPPPLQQHQVQHVQSNPLVQFPFKPSQRLVTTKYGNTFRPKESTVNQPKLNTRHSATNLIDHASILSLTTVPSVPIGQDISSNHAPDSVWGVNFNGRKHTSNNDPDIVWGSNSSGQNLAAKSSIDSNSLDGSLFPPTKRNTIFFPGENENETNSWKPVVQGFSLPSVQDTPPFPSSNTFARAFAAIATPVSVSESVLSSINTTHHLFVRTTAHPLAIGGPSSTAGAGVSAPVTQRTRSQTDGLTGEYHTTAPNAFVNSFLNVPPIDYEEPEYVIHLNSTERIEQLINLLKGYLKSPAHQLSSEFASWVGITSTPPKEALNRSTSGTTNSAASSLTTTERSALEDTPAKFTNGFLAVLQQPNSFDAAENHKHKTQVTKLELEHNFSILEPDQPINTRLNTVEVDIPFFDFKKTHSRPTPEPTKVSLFDERQDYDDFAFGADLVQSPSLSSLLSIARLPEPKSASSALPELHSSTGQPSSLLSTNLPSLLKQPSSPPPSDATNDEVEQGEAAITLRTRASDCPKLFGPLDLICDLETTGDPAELVASWRRRSYSSGERQLQVLSLGNQLLLKDPRLSVHHTLDSYSLRIQDFRIQDVGAYECDVRTVTGGLHATSQVIVFTCLR